MFKQTVFAFIVFTALLAAGPLHAQEADSSVASAPADPLHHSWFHHFLFDSTLASRVPIATDSEAVDQIAHYAGGITVVNVSRTGFRGELADSDCIAHFVDIRCSEESEYAEIERSADDTVDIRIYRRDHSTGGKGGAPIFEHQFTADKTSEIRIHLNGGDDYAIARGSVGSSIDVAVVGGQGSDELVDSSHVSGHLWHFLPFSKDQKKTYFFGEPNETNFIYSGSTVIDAKPSHFDDSATAQPVVRDWGRAVHYHPWLRGSSDEGAFIGAGISVIDYEFRADPFDKIMTLQGGYATTPGAYEAEFSEFFPHRLGGAISVSLRASSLDVLNFFGYGNTTPLDKTLYTNAGYRLHQQQYTLSHGYSFAPLEHTTIWGMVALRYVKTEADPIKDSSVIRKRYSYGIGPLTSMRFSAGIAFDSRDNERAASTGLYAGFSSYWTPEIINNSFAYTTLRADIRGFATFDIATPVTLALRMRAEKFFGEHPFYESALLGGAQTLRGYYVDRFAGEESILASGDLRIQIAKIDVFVPSTIGILGFFDAGRVYVDNDFSNLWHTSFGGGVWIAPYSPERTVALTVAHSVEATQFYLTTGFAF